MDKTETYILEVKDGRLEFIPSGESVPDHVLTIPFMPDNDTLMIVCRLGDTDLVSCSVFKYSDRNGGIFVLHQNHQPLLTARTSSNLAYCLGLGYFGKLVSYARYGSDIFLNLDDPDE